MKLYSSKTNILAEMLTKIHTFYTNSWFICLKAFEKDLFRIYIYFPNFNSTSKIV